MTRWHLGHRVFTNPIGVKGSGFARSCNGTPPVVRGLAERVTVHGSGPCPFTRAAFRLGQRSAITAPRATAGNVVVDSRDLAVGAYKSHQPGRPPSRSWVRVV